MVGLSSTKNTVQLTWSGQSWPILAHYLYNTVTVEVLDISTHGSYTSVTYEGYVK